MAHRNRWFTYQTWWFSMAMFNNQMVIGPWVHKFWDQFCVPGTWVWWYSMTQKSVSWVSSVFWLHDDDSCSNCSPARRVRCGNWLCTAQVSCVSRVDLITPRCRNAGGGQELSGGASKDACWNEPSTSMPLVSAKNRSTTSSHLRKPKWVAFDSRTCIKMHSKVARPKFKLELPGIISCFGGPPQMARWK